VSSGKATPEQVLAAVKVELVLLRRRRALLPPPTPATVALPAVPRHTTAEAVAALDARFPWLRGAEKREVTHRRPAQATGDDRRVA
jgi:hypothetical protein